MDDQYFKLINKYIDFKPWFNKIVNDFKFDVGNDYRARDILTGFLKEKEVKYNVEQILYSFIRLLQSKSNIIVYGCGPSLKLTVESILKDYGKEPFEKSINLAADGSAILLKDLNITIDAIFTDLDGIKTDISSNSFLIIHAHGDNISKLETFKKLIIRNDKILATTQVEPNSILFNPGGFTDGDRILFFINSFLLKTQNIYLIGMDFNDIVGSYSKPEFTEDVIASSVKRKKLKYAMNILEWFIKKYQKRLMFVNSPVSSEKFSYKSIEEFIKLL